MASCSNVSMRIEHHKSSVSAQLMQAIKDKAQLHSDGLMRGDWSAIMTGAVVKPPIPDIPPEALDAVHVLILRRALSETPFYATVNLVSNIRVGDFLEHPGSHTERVCYWMIHTMKCTNHLKSFSTQATCIFLLKALHCFLLRVPSRCETPFEDELAFIVAVCGPLAILLSTMGKRKSTVDYLVEMMDKIPSEKTRWTSRFDDLVIWALGAPSITPWCSKQFVQHLFALAAALRLPLRPIEKYPQQFEELHTICNMPSAAERFKIIYKVDHFRANSKCTELVCIQCGQYESDCMDDSRTIAVAQNYKCCGRYYPIFTV